MDQFWEFFPHIGGICHRLRRDLREAFLCRMYLAPGLHLAEVRLPLRLRAILTVAVSSASFWSADLSHLVDMEPSFLG